QGDGGRCLGAAGYRSVVGGGSGDDAAARPPGDADPATSEGPDDAVGGASQQADRLRARRLGGDHQGACLGDPAKARRREPHPGRHRGRENRRQPMASEHADGAVGLSERIRTAARRYDESRRPAMIAPSAAKASCVPSASPFSKSSPACPMVLVTWARQSTRTPAQRAKVYRAAASISTARMPLLRAASMASAVSRNGASVVQLAPTTPRSPLCASAAAALFTRFGSASANSDAGA